MNLTPKQVATLKFIRQYIRKYGLSPTLQEMADEFEVTKPTIHEHVHALVAHGAITITQHKNRSIRLCGEPGTCPLCKHKLGAKS